MKIQIECDNYGICDKWNVFLEWNWNKNKMNQQAKKWKVNMKKRKENESKCENKIILNDNDS